MRVTRTMRWSAVPMLFFHLTVGFRRKHWLVCIGVFRRFLLDLEIFVGLPTVEGEVRIHELS